MSTRADGKLSRGHPRGGYPGDLREQFGDEPGRQRLDGVDPQELLALKFERRRDEAGDRDREPAVLGARQRKASLLAVDDPRRPRAIAVGRDRDLERPGDGQSIARGRARDST